MAQQAHATIEKATPATGSGASPLLERPGKLFCMSTAEIYRFYHSVAYLTVAARETKTESVVASFGSLPYDLLYGTDPRGYDLGPVTWLVNKLRGRPERVRTAVPATRDIQSLVDEETRRLCLGHAEACLEGTGAVTAFRKTKAKDRENARELLAYKLREERAFDADVTQHMAVVITQLATIKLTCDVMMAIGGASLAVGGASAVGFAYGAGLILVDEALKKEDVGSVATAAAIPLAVETAKWRSSAKAGKEVGALAEKMKAAKDQIAWYDDAIRKIRRGLSKPTLLKSQGVNPDHVRYHAVDLEIGRVSETQALEKLRRSQLMWKGVNVGLAVLSVGQSSWDAYTTIRDAWR